MGLFRPGFSIGLTGFCVNEARARGPVTVGFLDGTFSLLNASLGLRELNPESII